MGWLNTSMFRVGPQIEALEQLLTSHRAALALNLQRRCAKIWVTTCHLRNVIHGFCLLRTNKHEMILDQKTITRWSFFHYRRRLMLGCFSYGVENRVRQPIIKIRLERRSTAINMVSVFSQKFYTQMKMNTIWTRKKMSHQRKYHSHLQSKSEQHDSMIYLGQQRKLTPTPFQPRVLRQFFFFFPMNRPATEPN